MCSRLLNEFEAAFKVRGKKIWEDSISVLNKSNFVSTANSESGLNNFKGVAYELRDRKNVKLQNGASTAIVESIDEILSNNGNILSIPEKLTKVADNNPNSMEIDMNSVDLECIFGLGAQTNHDNLMKKNTKEKFVSGIKRSWKSTNLQLTPKTWKENSSSSFNKKLSATLGEYFKSCIFIINRMFYIYTNLFILDESLVKILAVKRGSFAGQGPIAHICNLRSQKEEFVSTNVLKISCPQVLL